MPNRILVIEDEVGIASALEVRLSAMGYQAVCAHDGRSGLEAATTHHPDAILLDIRLPDIDGIEVCQRLKGNPDLADIPVVILSANVSDVSRGQAKDVGAVACLAKPYEVHDVVAAIESAIGSNVSEAQR